VTTPRANVESTINADVLQSVSSLANRFAARDPFRHVVIDQFFEPAFAKRLLEQFPTFERGNARNEAGELGGKSTVERIRELGASYSVLDDLVQSEEFLTLISQITGIEDLLYDPYYFGGGTHESREGQDLDAHVDFNRHPIEGWHRRLNLIVYLNHEWDDTWGGSLELHTNPLAQDNQIRLLTPLFNRCVIFETTEWSWHGFSRISLPSDRRDLTRRSIALYFYTRERPAEELADTHSTIYIDRPLPDRFHAGMTLNETDLEEIRTLLARRDQHNQRLYRDIGNLSSQLESARAALNSGKLGRLRYFAQRLRARLAG
jgi:Rps23 Pro-64 3,4-dihydroxylase Tpa1-like proline 4-hydroxylase